jgi:hypothetical protein
MRKVLSIPHYDLPYDEEQGLFFVAPHFKESPLNKEDYVELGHRSIVVVPESLPLFVRPARRWSSRGKTVQRAAPSPAAKAAMQVRRKAC